MKERPLSITLISWLFIISGSIALVSALLPIIGATPAQIVAEFKTHWMVHLLRLASIVSGLFMLRGHNWARWLLVVWMAIHIVIGALHSWMQLLLHALIFAVILFFLFRPGANGFFAR
ncbi:MAG TPA: hypothetical protein VFS77_17510 [Pyrinomonadaceae bacterium]|nr:hypothetical protein [Pyrinomonadaceae bacterium]